MYFRDTSSHTQHSRPQRTIGRCIVDVMTRHAYLPTLILWDKGSQFRSEVVAEITQIVEIQISHASTKHAQTVGILEKNTRFNQNSTKDIDGRKTFNVAQICVTKSQS